ncbi:VOC family protein [Nitrosovibrio sp. Nv17]|uniref:VOC family protein n=1 Tax=Nitrosovibrio sp. Nv17 TaxID=1855339 RepID=UPI000908A206|nr:VOC family protein [Nitrosovibrio sp. Nv17]SFW25717.1 PhnB protein [Nitrosovibrio sp. Nv17]
MKPLTPYLMFKNNAQEAMAFYQSCFGGTLEIRTFADLPEDMRPPGLQDTHLVMHACLTSDDLVLMASDDPTGGPEAGNQVQLSVNCESVEQIDALFDALGKNGNVIMPLAETFWARKFGMLVDRYGFSWMLNLPQENP